MRVGVPGTGAGEPEGSHTRPAHYGCSHAAGTKKPLGAVFMSACTFRDANPRPLNLQRRSVVGPKSTRCNVVLPWNPAGCFGERLASRVLENVFA